MNARVYAHALSRASATLSPDAAVAGLVRALKAKGRMKLLPQILRELVAEEGKKLASVPFVEVARTEDASAALAAAKAEGIDASGAVVNANLLKGWRARGNGILVDRSGKRNLVDLYRKITN